MEFTAQSRRKTEQDCSCNDKGELGLISSSKDQLCRAIEDVTGLSALLSLCERKRDCTVAVFMKSLVKCALSAEKRRGLLVVILLSSSAALHFLFEKTYRVALARRIKIFVSRSEYCSICMCDRGCYWMKHCKNVPHNKLLHSVLTAGRLISFPFFRWANLMHSNT